MDSGFSTGAAVTAVRRASAVFSVTAQINSAVRAACEAIDESAWTPIRSPQAVGDEDLTEWISDAPIAETTYPAFTGTPHPVTTRLIVRTLKMRLPGKSLRRTASRRG